MVLGAVCLPLIRFAPFAINVSLPVLLLIIIYSLLGFENCTTQLQPQYRCEWSWGVQTYSPTLLLTSQDLKPPGLSHEANPQAPAISSRPQVIFEPATSCRANQL